VKRFTNILFKTIQTVVVFPFTLILGLALGIGAAVLAIIGLPVYLTGIVIEDIWELDKEPWRSGTNLD